MCASPPKPKNKTSVEVKAPEVDLGSQVGASDTRNRLKRGRNQLRTDFGLGIPVPTTGLNVEGV